jgi:hypothetical protein
MSTSSRLDKINEAIRYAKENNLATWISELEKDKQIEEVFETVKTQAKPNFTQIQCYLQYLQASPEAYARLVTIMEKQFSLSPLAQIPEEARQ